MSTPTRSLSGSRHSSRVPTQHDAAPAAAPPLRSGSASRAASQRASRTPSQRELVEAGAPSAAAGLAASAGGLRSGGGDGAVVDMVGGRGLQESSGAAAAEEARLRELEDEHAQELSAQARQRVFEALARDFKAGRTRDLTLPSGVRLHTDVPGDCASFPYTAAAVRIHYEGFLIGADGLPAPTAFDSSRTRGQPHDYQHGAGFALAGLEEALGFMSQGSRCRIRVPPEMGYKDAGFPPTIPPKAALLYDVELIAFE